MDIVTASTRRHRRLRTESAGGVAGNERLTALTGAVLLAGFTVGGFAVLSLRGLLTLHIFLGMLLIGPVALKISSTVYRFARYYSGAAPYVRKGPDGFPRAQRRPTPARSTNHVPRHVRTAPVESPPLPGRVPGGFLIQEGTWPMIRRCRMPSRSQPLAAVTGHIPASRTRGALRAG
jgi:hypothetical protein